MLRLKQNKATTKKTLFWFLCGEQFGEDGNVPPLSPNSQHTLLTLLYGLHHLPPV